MKLSTWIAVLVLAPPSASTAQASLPLVNDDYARARQEATERHLPLFVDVWAPW